MSTSTTTADPVAFEKMTAEELKLYLSKQALTTISMPWKGNFVSGQDQKTGEKYMYISGLIYDKDLQKSVIVPSIMVRGDLTIERLKKALDEKCNTATMKLEVGGIKDVVGHDGKTYHNLSVSIKEFIAYQKVKDSVGKITKVEDMENGKGTKKMIMALSNSHHYNHFIISTNAQELFKNAGIPLEKDSVAAIHSNGNFSFKKDSVDTYENCYPRVVKGNEEELAATLKEAIEKRKALAPPAEKTEHTLTYEVANTQQKMSL